MNRPCREVAEWLARPRSELADAQRLVLERHLAECAECRRTSELLRVVTSIVVDAPVSLDPRARERALRAALTTRSRVPLEPRRSRVVQLGVAIAVAAALTLGVRSLLEPEVPTGAPTQIAQGTPSQPPAPAAPEPAAPEPAEKWLDIDAAGTRTFGHASVAMTSGTRVRFLHAASTLELAAGQLEVDVDASRGRQFVVLTQNFRVLVMGTQFLVSTERVSVRHGHVQVVALDGTQLADLTDHGTYPLVQDEPAAPAPERARELLARARSELSREHVEVARQLVHQAERVAVTARDKAEIGTITAECALVAGQPAAAIEAYLGVARRFSKLSAGENALFASAQLSQRSADAGTALKLFMRYLQHYPRGRFADEARARVATLTP